MMNVVCTVTDGFGHYFRCETDRVTRLRRSFRQIVHVTPANSDLGQRITFFVSTKRGKRVPHIFLYQPSWRVLFCQFQFFLMHTHIEWNLRCNSDC